MKVLITGATGFVGSHLTERLVHAGYEVRALARSSSDTSFLRSLGVELVTGDIRDRPSVERAADGCGRICHLAAVTTGRRLSKATYYAVNAEGTDHVARAALDAQVERLVYCSGGGVYGRNLRLTVTEATPAIPDTNYRVSKLAGERLLHRYRDTHGLPVVVARITSVYGPGSKNWLGLFRTVAQKIRMIGRGGNRQHMGYVTDVTDGLKRCGEVDGIEGETYIITGAAPVTINRLVHLIREALQADTVIRTCPAAPFIRTGFWRI